MFASAAAATGLVAPLAAGAGAGLVAGADIVGELNVVAAGIAGGDKLDFVGRVE